MGYSAVPPPRRTLTSLSPALTFVFLTLVASAAHAIELHSFIDEQCHATTGVLVRVDESSVQLIRLDGTFARIPVEGVHVLAIHKVLENPLARIVVDDSLR